MLHRIRSAARALLRRTLASTGAVLLSLSALAPQALHGAERPPSWALRPVVAPAIPAVLNPTWPQTPIDRFILAQLEAKGLHPAPRADKRTLIRRATFDLTGLPPTSGEIDAFLADPSPNAFATVVDRLLNSPHYGERWGRHWLDVARYADNKGYVFFEEKTYPWAWTYRDYVVRAFNEDKPFDRFVLEQLAADQLEPGADPRNQAALGFLTVGDHFSNNTHDILDDRIDVVTRGLLGLTVGCARCHDHKFDPVSQADYYALYGVFRSCTEPMVPPLIEPVAGGNPYECFLWELVERERKLREYVEGKHGRIVADARARIGGYLAAVYAQRDQPTTESFMLLADPGDLNPTVIARWRRQVERAGAADPVWAPWHAFAALEERSFAEQAPAVHARLFNVAPGTNGVPPRINARIQASLAGAPPKSMQGVIDAYSAALVAVEKQWQEALAKASGNPTAARPNRLPDAADEELRGALYGPDAAADIPLQLDWGFLSLLPDRASQGEFQVLLKDLEQWLINGPEAPPRAMVLTDLPVAYTPRVFQRGNPNRPGAIAPRRFLGAVDPRPLEHGSGRLDLARAIVDPRNPLTARVFVNRVWLHHFGAGLVTTPGDFGARSDPPSHPELLDWLADDFVRHGWHVKRLHRLILNSAVYQQSSAAPAAESDPDNRLLSRMNRRRHDFETQRDALLAVSGTLDPRVGGAPVQPGTPRRALYTFINRMDVPPLMTTFDFPSPSTSCPQRTFTTVPPQALYLMNNEAVADAAAAVLKRREVAGVETASERVAQLYGLLFARPPSQAEQRRAAEFLGATPDGAAWQRYVHALLLVNEFVFVD